MWTHTRKTPPISARIAADMIIRPVRIAPKANKSIGSEKGRAQQKLRPHAPNTRWPAGHEINTRRRHISPLGGFARPRKQTLDAWLRWDMGFGVSHTIATPPARLGQAMSFVLLAVMFSGGRFDSLCKTAAARDHSVSNTVEHNLLLCTHSRRRKHAI